MNYTIFHETIKHIMPLDLGSGFAVINVLFLVRSPKLSNTLAWLVRKV